MPKADLSIQICNYNPFHYTNMHHGLFNPEALKPKTPLPKPCDRCKKHRVKCDRNPLQCNHCKKRGIACTYVSVPKKRGPKSRVDAAIEYFESLTKTKLTDSSIPTPTNQSSANESVFDSQFCDNSSELSPPQQQLVQLNPYNHLNWINQPQYTTSPLSVGMFSTSQVPIYNQGDFHQLAPTLTPKPVYDSYFSNMNMYFSQNLHDQTQAQTQNHTCELMPEFPAIVTVPPYTEITVAPMIQYAQQYSFPDNSGQSSPLTAFSPQLP